VNLSNPATIIVIAALQNPAIYLYLYQFRLVPASFVSFLFKIYIFYISVQHTRISHTWSLLLHMPTDFFLVYLLFTLSVHHAPHTPFYI